MIRLADMLNKPRASAESLLIQRRLLLLKLKDSYRQGRIIFPLYLDAIRLVGYILNISTCGGYATQDRREGFHDGSTFAALFILYKIDPKIFA
jgi:hypothetical protein